MNHAYARNRRSTEIRRKLMETFPVGTPFTPSDVVEAGLSTYRHAHEMLRCAKVALVLEKSKVRLKKTILSGGRTEWEFVNAA